MSKHFSSKSVKPFESSMFSLHSNGQDSWVDFLSSRELYETSPDSFNMSQSSQGARAPRPKRSNSLDLLCPRHAKAQMEIKHKNNVGPSGGVHATDSR